MTRCEQCGRADDHDGAEDAPDAPVIEVAGYVFVAESAEGCCPTCGGALTDIQPFELCVAGELVRAGETSGAAFGFMRRALGLSPSSLAEILDVPAESVSRWERNDHVYRSAWERLAVMVLDRLEGRRTEIEPTGVPPPERLADVCAPRRLPQRVRVPVRRVS